MKKSTYKDLLWVLIALPGLMLSGFTIMTFWGWYIVPLGVPAINLAHAIGIDTLVVFLVTTRLPKNTNAEENRLRYLVESLSFTLSILLMGWAFHFFV